MKKTFALLMLALVMCCCGHQTPKVEAPAKTNKEIYPEKFTAAYITQRAQSLIDDVSEPKMVKSLAIVNENIAKIKINYLNNDHDLVLKFVDGEWQPADERSCSCRWYDR